MPSKALLKVSLATVFFRADLLSKASTQGCKNVSCLLVLCSFKVFREKKKISVCEMEAALCQQFTWVCRIFSSCNFSWLRQNWFLTFHQMEKSWCYWCESLLLIPVWFWMVLAKKKKNQFKCSPYSLTHCCSNTPSPWGLSGGFWEGESQQQQSPVSGSISIHPSEELHNAPSLDFLSSIPKFGLSSEIL